MGPRNIPFSASGVLQRGKFSASAFHEESTRAIGMC